MTVKAQSPAAKQIMHEYLQQKQPELLEAVLGIMQGIKVKKLAMIGYEGPDEQELRNQLMAMSRKTGAMSQ